MPSPGRLGQRDGCMEGEASNSLGAVGSEGSRIVVLKCRNCGDTYPHDELEPIRCPTCGSAEADVAGEPLL